MCAQILSCQMTSCAEWPAFYLHVWLRQQFVSSATDPRPETFTRHRPELLPTSNPAACGCSAVARSLPDCCCLMYDHAYNFEKRISGSVKP